MTSATQSVAESPSEKGRITGWHVLIGVVLFFATVIAIGNCGASEGAEVVNMIFFIQFLPLISFRLAAGY